MEPGIGAEIMAEASRSHPDDDVLPVTDRERIMPFYEA